MKTIFALLLLTLLVSCARKPVQEEWPPYAFTSRETPEQTAQTDAAPYTLPVEVETPVNIAAADPEAETAAARAVAGIAPGQDVVVTNPAASPFDRPPQQPVPPLAPSTAPAAAGGLSAAAMEETIPAGMIDFRNMPLDDFLRVYGDYVGRTLLRPSNLTGQGGPQITLTIRTSLTRREVIQAMDKVLGLNGITIINIDDKFATVVPVGQAHAEAGPLDTRDAGDLPNLGPYVSHVVQLKYVKPSEIVQALQPFQKIPNSVVAIDSSQILVIRDYTENVKRMLEMIKQVDVIVPSEFISEVIPIKYAKAPAIADALNSLSGGGGSTTIARSTTAGQPGLAPRAPGGAMGAMGAMGGGARPGTAGYTMPGQATTTPGAVNPGGAPAGAAAGGSFTDRLNNIIRRAATGSGDLSLIGMNKIIADERSNSLLIFASRQDMEMIKSVVEKLDVVLAQVLIETVIMDVQMGNALNYGVTAGQGPGGSTNGFAFGGVNNNTGTGGTPLDTLNRFFHGLGSTNIDMSSGRFPAGTSGLTYFGRYRGDLDVVINAAASDSRINVIQKPRILTSHATPGSIFVGNTVPYVTSTYYGGGFGGGPSSSYQQLSVGIGLTVTPFINPDGLVVMTIDETIDEIAGSTPIAGVGDVPNTTSRRLSAEVAVRDGDTIILGGFIRNSSNKQNAGIPLLKDIPLLGVLFSSRSDASERKELLVLMRPTVLKTPDIAALASVQEKRRLPGISAAEADVLELEKKELERQRKREMRTPQPVLINDQ